MNGSRVCLCLLVVVVSVSAGASATVLRPVADAFVSGGSPNVNYGTAGSLELKNIGDSASDLTSSRKVYIRFDCTSHNEITRHAELSFYMIAAPYGQDAPQLRTWEFALYGLLESSDTWSQSTLTWQNAPGNSTTAGGGVKSSKVYGGAPLATFTVYGPGTAGNMITITGNEGSPLANFINADTDHSLSFILVRTTRGDMNDTVTHALASSEYKPAGGQVGDWAPTLTLLPEPTSLAMLGVMGAGLLRRRLGRQTKA